MVALSLLAQGLPRQVQRVVIEARGARQRGSLVLRCAAVRVRNLNTFLTSSLLLLAGCAHESASAPPAVPADPPAATQQAPAKKPLPPAPFRLPLTVAPTSYDIELVLDPASDTFAGRERIDVEVKEKVDVLWLHSREQEISSAQLEVGGERAPLEVTRASGDLIALRASGGFAPGPASLHLEWTGKVNDTSARGLFRRKEGEHRYLFTQMQPLDARQVFPSFDEPGFKVPFKVTLVVPNGQPAFANMPEEKRAPAAQAGFDRVAFARTPPLPTYLVAFAVGPFETVDAGTAGANKTPLRVLVSKGRSGDAAFAAKEIPKLVEAAEAYFGRPFPYPKLDSIEIPAAGGFFGAMENPGLVTFISDLLVVAPGQESLQRQRSFAEAAAHEYAHQWFGDLVTPAWWDDIWLNEAFASWMEVKLVDQVYPEWRFDMVRASGRGSAVGADSLTTARQVRQPVQNDGDVLNAFDGITYAKGAAVIAMFERQLGEERFRDAIRKFIATHEHGTATSQDFLAALAGPGGEDVVRAFATFIDQPGVPELSFDLVCEKGKTPLVNVSQRRYLPLGVPETARQTWRVPICMRYPEGKTCGELTSPKSSFPLSAAKGCPKWVVPNDGAYGYYVSRLSPSMLKALQAAKPDPLSTQERMQLLSDSFMLLRNGALDAGEVLALIGKMSSSPSADRHVLAPATESLAVIGRILAVDALADPFARWVGRTWGPRARAVGVAPKKGEGREERLLRPLLISLAASIGDDAKVRGAITESVRTWLDGKAEIDPELLGVYLRVAARSSDAALHQALRKKVLATSHRRERVAILAVLGVAQDPAVARKNLEFALLSREVDATEGSRVMWAASQNVHARDALWGVVTAHYDELMNRLGPQMMAYMPYVASDFCDAAKLEEARVFFSERLDRAPGSERVLAQALELGSQCIRIREAQQKSVAAFLEAR